MIGTQSMHLALVDDHKLFRKGLISLIKMVCTNCTIIFEADNGIDMQQKLQGDKIPDIIMMDINMPQMDGFASAKWVKENFPSIKILVITMIEEEDSIVRMFRLGVKGYLSKDVEPQELGEALKVIMNNGSYRANAINGKLIHTILKK